MAGTKCWLITLQIALEELAERVNGDMRMALNQLQYMSLSMSVINYDDVRQRLQASAKDEDISPFTAVDKYVLMVLFLSLQCCFRCLLFKVMSWNNSKLDSRKKKSYCDLWDIIF